MGRVEIHSKQVAIIDKMCWKWGGNSSYRWGVLTFAKNSVHCTRYFWHGRRVMLLLRHVLDGHVPKTFVEWQNRFSQTPTQDPMNSLRAQLLETSSYETNPKSSRWKWEELKFMKKGRNSRWDVEFWDTSSNAGCDVLKLAKMNDHFTTCVWHGRRIMLFVGGVFEVGFKTHGSYNDKIMFRSPKRRSSK